MLYINNVSYGYETGTYILKDINIQIPQGDYIAILGESGCGKSTLLEIIYGLMDLEEGSIYHEDRLLLGPKFHLVPGHPFMKYLSQDFNLMPYTSVAENIGEYLSNFYKEEKKQRINELLAVIDMTSFRNTKVKHLSGGQKQRVAIAKVLAKEPQILLLDEPFSHIDNFRKNNFRRKLFSYLKKQNITCIVATHDSTDALSFADKIYVLKEKRITIEGTPKELYENPKSKYMASFFNEVNEIPNHLLGIENEGTSILYPHQLRVCSENFIKAQVQQNYFKGDHYLISMQLENESVLIKHKTSIPVGEIVSLTIVAPLP